MYLLFECSNLIHVAFLSYHISSFPLELSSSLMLQRLCSLFFFLFFDHSLKILLHIFF